jgi:hypothetical protein
VAVRIQILEYRGANTSNIQIRTLPTKEIRDIGKDLGLPTPFPGLLFSVAPDGRSVACTAER